MAARSKRLAGPVRLPTTTALVLLYTVPAGKTALLKSIRATGTGLPTVSVYFYRGGSGAWADVLGILVVPSGQTVVDPDTDPVVLDAGETLYASVSAASTSPPTVVVSGAEVSA